MKTLVKMLADPKAFGEADYSLDEIEIYMNTDRRHYMASSADSPLQCAAP
jgi:hypothetical protein